MDVQREQDGVVSRRQLVEAHPRHDQAAVDGDIERKLRRREWATIYPGVYVDHTGPPTWRQLAWAAVLFYWPAALADASALHAWGVRGFEPVPGEPIRVCVDRERSIRRQVGINVRQIARADTLCAMQVGPPRQRLEHAFIDVASAQKRLEGSVAVLSDAVQAGRTTPERLVSAIRERTRLRQRAIMLEVLGEVGHGVRSALEYRYLVHVERAHGLPPSVRQRPAEIDGSRVYRDVEYVDYGVFVELDGKIGHQWAGDRWDDLDRDITAAVSGQATLRPGWRHVLEPCRLAESVAAVLTARGWTGHIHPCGPFCATSPAPGAGDVAQTG